MKNTLKVLVGLVAIAPLAVHAQIFMCKDSTGRTITSDRPIPECADKKVQVRDKQGIARKEIAAPLTEAQKQEKKLQDEKIAAEKLAAEVKEKEDRTMRARYRNEGDIELARKRSVEIVQEHIKREARSLSDAEKNHKDVLEQIASEKNATPAKQKLDQARLAEADFVVKDQKRKVTEYEAEITQLNAKHDALLKRYRELNSTAVSK